LSCVYNWIFIQYLIFIKEVDKNVSQGSFDKNTIHLCAYDPYDIVSKQKGATKINRMEKTFLHTTTKKKWKQKLWTCDKYLTQDSMKNTNYNDPFWTF